MDLIPLFQFIFSETFRIHISCVHFWSVLTLFIIDVAILPSYSSCPLPIDLCLSILCIFASFRIIYFPFGVISNDYISSCTNCSCLQYRYCTVLCNTVNIVFLMKINNHTRIYGCCRCLFPFVAMHLYYSSLSLFVGPNTRV